MRAAPEEWRHVTAEYRATGRYFELAAEVRTADGALRAWSPPHEVAGLFSRLRAGMYRDGRGSWSNARYQLDHPSSYNLDFDRAEPTWTTPPPPQAYLDEMRFFPRTEENVPDWLRRRLQQTAPPLPHDQPLHDQPLHDQPLHDQPSHDQSPHDQPQPPRAFRTARVFDGAGPGGRPSVSRPPVAEADRDLLLSYLDRAPVAVIGRGFDADVLNPDAPALVPVAFQTDGHWIWPAAVGYYLRTYGVPPEPELVERAKAQDFVLPEVTEEVRVAAAANLGAPAAPQGTTLPVPEPVEQPEVGATVAAPLPDPAAEDARVPVDEPGPPVDVEETANLTELRPEIIEYAQDGPPYRVRFDEDGPVIDDRYRRESYVDGMDLFAPAAYEREAAEREAAERESGEVESNAPESHEPQLHDTQTWNPFTDEESDPEPAEEAARTAAVTDEPAHTEPGYERPGYERSGYEQSAEREPQPHEERADARHSAVHFEDTAENTADDTANDTASDPANDPANDMVDDTGEDAAEVTAEFEVDQDRLYAPERTESRFAEPEPAEREHAEREHTEREHIEPEHVEAVHTPPQHTGFAEPHDRFAEQAESRFAEQAFSDPDEQHVADQHDADQHDADQHVTEQRISEQHVTEQVPPPFADQATQFSPALELFDDVDPPAPPAPSLTPAPVEPPVPVEAPKQVEPRQVTPEEERELSAVRRTLDGLDVPPSAYRFGGEPVDRTWMLRVDGQDWEVSYVDHGPTNAVRFDRLEDAAAYLIGRLVLTNRRAPRPPAPMPPPPPQQRPPRPPMNTGPNNGPNNGLNNGLNNGFREEPRRPGPPQRPPVEPPASAQATQVVQPAPQSAAATSTQEPKSQRSWPINPMNGEPPLTLFRHKKMVELPAGMEVDRFGEGEGNLVYAAGTPFAQRSLVPSWINRPYHVYRLRRPVEVLTGIAVPWFEQPGGGTAYLMPKTIDDMVADGVLVEVANQDAPNH
ncbi:glycohydrolase toxin TNT-related protein [Saccharothrix isguenensis]